MTTGHRQKAILPAGFALIFVLMGLIILVSVRSLDTVVDHAVTAETETSEKLIYIKRMRNVIQRRSLILAQISSQKEFFDRYQARESFNALAREFLQDRDHLQSLLTTPKEREIWDRLQESLRENRSRIQSAVDLAVEGEADTDLAFQMKIATDTLANNYLVLAELDAQAEQHRLRWKDDTYASNAETRMLLLLLGGGVLVAGFAIAMFVVRREREVRNELMLSTEQAVSNEDKYSRLLEGSLQGIVVVRDWEILFVNGSYTEIFGYETPDELIGVNMLDQLVTPEERDRLLARGERHERGEAVDNHLETFGVRRDGEIIRLDCLVSAIDWEGEAAFQVAIIDVTERKRYEENLLSSEASLRAAESLLDSAIQSFSEGFVLFDADDRYVFANEHYLNTHPIVREVQQPGTKFAEIVHKLAEAGFYGSEIDNIDEFVQSRIELFRTGKPYQYCTDDDVWFEVFSYRTADGGTALVRSDITERKKLEQKLAHAQRMEAVGQLTGGVAHDFNNLLAVMVGNAEIIEHAVGDDDTLRKNARTIIQAVDRGASLTNRLLAFSRQQPLVPAASDIKGLIANLEDMLRRTLGETIEMKVDSGPDLWPATIDPHQFENALINLAINARDAMASGGELAISSSNVVLDEEYARRQDEVMPGDYVEVSVRDTGTGMPPETLKKAFEPFFTTKEVGEGSGLGLSMVYGFAKQTKGHASIESEPGRGTTVRLFLPRSYSDVSDAQTPDEKSDPERGSERILVVEDDPGVREVPVALLRNQGYEIVEATDGKEAIENLNGGEKFDLIFTDIVLPGGLNGVEIAAEAKKIQPDIKVLFTTGYAENDVVEQGQLDPELTLVSKPYRRTELLDKVRAVLDGDK